MFTNQCSDFSLWVDRLFQLFEKSGKKLHFEIDKQRARRTQDFVQLFLQGRSAVLKIDMVNDIAPHFGEFTMHAAFGKVDGLRNMLSNKISALGRLEIKDFVDVWCITRNIPFNWAEIVGEARQKDAGVDPLMVYRLFKTIPKNLLDAIRWTGAVDYSSFFKDMEVIAEDVLEGRDNSMAEDH